MVISTVNQVVYNGDGITTAWPFTFRIIDATDIKLLLIDADGTETDVSADYYVDMVNNTVYYPGYAPGAEPPEEDQPPKVQTGQKLVVYRELPITQEKDLGDKWPFYVIELGLDKLTMILQQIFDWWGRTLKISQGGSVEGFDTNVYPEAGKVISVNEDGDGFEGVTAMTEQNNAWDGKGMQIKSVAEPTDNTDVATKSYVDSYADANFMKLGGEYWESRSYPIQNVQDPYYQQDAATKNYVDGIIAGIVAQGNDVVVLGTVAIMKATDLEVGMYVATAGYYNANDGGNGFYLIRSDNSDTDDGGSTIILDNGNVAELINDGRVNISQFGAVGDGVTDDTAAIQAAVDTAKYIYFNADESYLISASIKVLQSGVTLDLNGATVFADTSGSTRYIQNCTSDETTTAYSGHGDLTVKNGTLIHMEVCVAHAKNITIQDIDFKNSGGHFIQVMSCYNVLISRCTFKGISDSAADPSCECVNLDPCDHQAFGLYAEDSAAYDNTDNDYVVVEKCVSEVGTDTGFTNGLQRLGISHYHVDGLYHHHVIIRDNMITNASASANSLRCFDLYDAEIYGNIINSFQNNVIKIRGGARNNIHNNSVFKRGALATNYFIYIPDGYTEERLSVHSNDFNRNMRSDWIYAPDASDSYSFGIIDPVELYNGSVATGGDIVISIPYTAFNRARLGCGIVADGTYKEDLEYASYNQKTGFVAGNTYNSSFGTQITFDANSNVTLTCTDALDVRKVWMWRDSDN